jgi:putative nucleotidyltransferase with HDIG domain
MGQVVNIDEAKRGRSARRVAEETPGQAPEREHHSSASVLGGLPHQSPGLEYLIERVGEVPTLPSTVARILEISADSGSSAADLARVIYLDQALASRILRVANSSFYGLTRGVRTLEHAAVILGFRDIRNITLAMSVFSSFFAHAEGTSFDRAGFWKHSLSCGLGAKVVADATGLNKTEIFVAGLIHDLGKVVLDRYHHEGFLATLAAARGGLPAEEAERQVLGYTHAEVGAGLLETWKFPAELVRPVAFHHCPWDDDLSPRRSSAVFLGDLLARLHAREDYAGQPRPNGREVEDALGQANELGVSLPASFLAEYAARLAAEIEGMAGYLDCIIPTDMLS